MYSNALTPIIIDNFLQWLFLSNFLQYIWVSVTPFNNSFTTSPHNFNSTFAFYPPTLSPSTFKIN